MMSRSSVIQMTRNEIDVWKIGFATGLAFGCGIYALLGAVALFIDRQFASELLSDSELYLTLATAYLLSGAVLVILFRRSRCGRHDDE